MSACCMVDGTLTKSNDHLRNPRDLTDTNWRSGFNFQRSNQRKEACFYVLIALVKAWKKSKKNNWRAVHSRRTKHRCKVFAFQAVDLHIKVVTNGIKKAMALNIRRVCWKNHCGE